MELDLRLIDRRELPGFRQYLLPSTALALEREEEGRLAIGAVYGRYSLGAAAVQVTGEGEARITDVFVDAAARGQGVGSLLLEGVMYGLRKAGASYVTAGYTLNGAELQAMDRLMVKNGFSEPVLRSRTFGASSRDYKDHPAIGRSFRPDWRTPENVRALSELTDGERQELMDGEDIPDMLSLENLEDRVDPELSVAMTGGGRVLAYMLAEESGDGNFVLLSAVSRKGAGAGAFMTLLTELINRCFYRKGGEYTLFFSAVNEHTERLARSIMGGKCVEYEEHVCYWIAQDQEETETDGV